MEPGNKFSPKEISNMFEAQIEVVKKRICFLHTLFFICCLAVKIAGEALKNVKAIKMEKTWMFKRMHGAVPAGLCWIMKWAKKLLF